MSKILFKEEQKFTQWWLWLLLLSPLAVLIYSIFEPIFSEAGFTEGNYSFLNSTSSDFWIPFFILLSILVLFMLLKLKTEITKERISMRYFPLFSKEWLWIDIEKAEVINYGFVGYGIRISLKHGMVYNVKGTKGLALLLKNGKKIVLGTQRPEELEHILRRILNNDVTD
tara:strand:- start:497 stop:1006 length:510 start_codon:yes stop_codon:yes gene_type:complete